MDIMTEFGFRPSRFETPGQFQQVEAAALAAGEAQVAGSALEFGGGLIGAGLGFIGLQQMRKDQRGQFASSMKFNKQKMNWMMRKWGKEFDLARQQFDAGQSQFLQNLGFAKEQFEAGELWKGREFGLTKRAARQQEQMASIGIKQARLGLSEASRQVRFKNKLREMIAGRLGAQPA